MTLQNSKVIHDYLDYEFNNHSDSSFRPENNSNEFSESLLEETIRRQQTGGFIDNSISEQNDMFVYDPDMKKGDIH